MLPRFLSVNYDHLTKNVTKGLTELMSFVGLPVTSGQRALLDNKNVLDNAHGNINVDSGKQSQHWRAVADFSAQVEPVQAACGDVISRLGLRTFHTEDQLRDLTQHSTDLR